MTAESGTVSRDSGDVTKAEMKKAKRKYTQYTMICNVAFFLLFSSFVGLAIMQSSVNGKDGVAGLSIIFMVTIVACVCLAPVANSLLGSKTTLVACFAGFAAWESSNLYPHLALIIPTAIACGAANGTIWAAHGTYFTRLSVAHAKLTSVRVDALITRAFGVFFCFLLLGTSFGCLLTSLAMMAIAASRDPTNSSADSFDSGEPSEECGARYCRGQSASGTSYVMYAMVVIHVACCGLGMVLIVLFVGGESSTGEDRETDGETLTPAKQALTSIVGTLRQLKRRRQLLMTPLNTYAGISKSFMLAEITEAYIGCAIGIDMIGFATVSYGIFACIVSFTCGFLFKKTGRIPIYTAAFVSALAMIFFMLFWVPDPRQEGLFFIIPGLWAIADAILVSQMNAHYGNIFHDNTQGAFATFRFWEGIGVVLGYIFNIYICVYEKLLIMLAVLIVGMVGYYVTEWVQLKLELAAKAASATEAPCSSVAQTTNNAESDNTAVKTDNNNLIFYIAEPRRRSQTSDGSDASYGSWQKNNSYYCATHLFESSI